MTNMFTRLRVICLFMLLIGYSVLSAQSIYELHWDSAADPNFSGSGGGVLNQLLDSTCSYLELSVADTANAPLGSFSPLIINPQMMAGGDLVDLSGNMSFHVRVRSKATVALGFLLRSGDGTSPFRTSRIAQTVPGDTSAWTELTYTFDASSIGGFDSTDLRDIWLYLDAGSANFNGDEFYIDYFSIGEAPDSSTFSTCTGGGVVNPPEDFSYAIHFDSNSDPLFSGSAAASLTQSIDTACSQIFLTVTDTATTPWNGTSPIIINPMDSMGNDITDLSTGMSFHLRVRSLDTVDVALLLRSGDGTSAFRTSRVSQTVPGDTLMWTELTYTFDTTSLGGFDSTDLRDIWLYLDYGVNNFRGNKFWIDYFAIGPKPGADTHSGCSLIPPYEFPWILHWADSLDQLTSGTGAAQLTQVLDMACSELKISVTETILDPHVPFKTLRLNPVDERGNEITDISGNLKFYARVKSLAEVEFTVRLRGGDGTEEQRSEFISYTVPAGLDQWTDLVFDFGGSNLGGFDSTDLRDIFMYLNREEANFPGNEFYFDYASLGSAPADSLNSTCVTTSLDDPLGIDLKIYPNPVILGQKLHLELSASAGSDLRFGLLSISGQEIGLNASAIEVQPGRYSLRLPKVVPGLYLLKISGDFGTQFQKIVIKN